MMNDEQRGRTNQVVGILLVVLGGIFLLGQLFGVNIWRVAWPFYVIIPGVLILVFGLAAGPSASIVTILGSMTTVTGLLLLYQSTTNHWVSWAYAWALVVPGSIGAGSMLHGVWTHQHKMVDDGLRLATVGVVLFGLGWVFFELVLGLGGFVNQAVGRVVGPLLLIAVGAYLLWRRNADSPLR